MRYTGPMRTTVDLAADVASAVQRLRRDRAIGLSEAVNELIRAGLTKKERSTRFRQKTHDLGKATIDYSNVADAIESADGTASR